MISPEMIDILGVVAILGVTFYLVFIEFMSRSTLLLGGAVATILWGIFRGFFDGHEALEAVSLTTIMLLVLMTVLANILYAAGLFDWISIRIAQLARGSRKRLFVYLTLFTFVFSLFSDNLTVIVIMGALTIALLHELEISPEPYIISELVASNLGGAATLIGDFPNLIISEKAGIPFVDFIKFGGMFPANVVIQLAVLVFLMWLFREELRDPEDLADQTSSILPVVTMGRRSGLAIRNKRALISGLAGLSLSLVLFATEAIHGIEPVTIALVGAVLALATSGLSHRDMIDEVGLENVMAFVGLFILAGALTATGVLSMAVGILLELYAFNPVLASLLFMIFIATVTATIDAGPTAAAFTPLIALLETQIAGPPHFLWWTLSFGVLAGSSSTILGATAGQIAASQVEQYHLASEATTGSEGTSPRKSRGFVRKFTLAGAPSGAIMIGLATLYLWLLFLTY